MKKLLATAIAATSLLSLSITSVQALPYFVEAFARRHCEYLALGIEWDKAASMSMEEYYEQIKDYDSRVISAAMFEACYDMNLDAFEAHMRRKESEGKN